MKQPRISIVIPIHNMKNGDFFLWRAVNSILEQDFKDYEIIITKEGKMAENTNSAIKRARGEIVKILYLDDWLTSPYSLSDIDLHFKEEDEWMITGASTNPKPQWTENIHEGNNKLGSPSALTFRNHFDDNLLFDENLSWLLDCDLYKRLNDRYGKPKILEAINVSIGVHDGQMTNLLTDDYKLSEHMYMQNKKYE